MWTLRAVEYASIESSSIYSWPHGPLSYSWRAGYVAHTLDSAPNSEFRICRLFPEKITFQRMCFSLFQRPLRTLALRAQTAVGG